MKRSVGDLPMAVVDAACELLDAEPDTTPSAFQTLESAVDTFRHGVSRNELEGVEK